MPYILKFSDPTTSTFITVPDMPPGINTSDTSLNLVGRGYPNYGQKTAENFLHLLENFANGYAPANPIQGQLWYNSDSNKLQVNTSRNGQGWSPVNGVWQQSIDPSISTTTNVLPGDIWVNTSDNNYILSVRTNSDSWVQVSNTSTGATGSFSTELFDNVGQPHWVVEHKSLGVVIAIDTADTFFPNPAIQNFNAQLNTGTNMTTVGKFWGTAFSADALNLYPGSQTIRVPTNRLLIKDDDDNGSIPGPGQIITGRVFFQNSKPSNPRSPKGIALTSSDDPTGTNGLIEIYKSNNDLVLLNDRNPDFGYGNILLNTRLARGSVKINSAALSLSTVSGALTIVGGAGIGGDVWIGGSVHVKGALHAGLFVAGSADNIYGGNPGDLVYQSSTGTTGFIGAGSVGSILQVGTSTTATFVSSSSIRVGYSDNANTLLGGTAGQFVVQVAANQTGFINPSQLSVNTATNSNNLNGPAGTIPVQTGENQTSYISTSNVQVGYAKNILGGSAGQFVVQTGANQTGFADPSTLAVENVLGGANGSLVYQTAANITGTLPIGSAGQYLKVSTNVPHIPEWDSPTGLTANQVAYGQGTGSELIGDSGMQYNPLTQVLTVLGDVIAGSDRDLKDNIKTITNALEKTLSLRGVSFNYKKGGRANIGLIAQEVQEIVPEVVSVNESTGFLGVGYGALVGLLVEAIKEQQVQIDELKRRIG
jgi:hypothetical protein